MPSSFPPSAYPRHHHAFIPRALIPPSPQFRYPRPLALITVSCLHQDMRTGVWRLLAAPKAASYMIGCWLSTQGNISLAATAFSPKLAM